MITILMNSINSVSFWMGSPSSDTTGKPISGIITDSTKQRLEELEANKKELETNIAIEELQKPMLTKDQILFWLYKFRKLDVTKLESRRRLVDSFVNSIIVYDDYILINFNY